jgi:hypothetical protein
MSVWTEARAATAALTRTVTGAILAPHETQRLVVSDKTGNYSSAWPGKSKCAPIDLGGEMVTPFPRRTTRTWTASAMTDECLPSN